MASARDEAVAAGLKSFVSTTPCKHGHVGRRFVFSYSCLECARLKAKAARDQAKATKPAPVIDREAVAEREKASAEKRSAYQKEHYQQNRDRTRERRRLARIEALKYNSHKPQRPPRALKRPAEETKKLMHARSVEYARKRRAADPLFRFKHNARSVVATALHKGGYRKQAKTEQILGCTFAEFQTHIERQFLPGMGWHNRHAWHIDHIVAMATATTEAEALALNHFTNLRPIWKRDNLAKQAKRTHLI